MVRLIGGLMLFSGLLHARDNQHLSDGIIQFSVKQPFTVIFETQAERPFNQSLPLDNQKLRQAPGSQQPDKEIRDECDLSESHEKDHDRQKLDVCEELVQVRDYLSDMLLRHDAWERETREMVELYDYGRLFYSLPVEWLLRNTATPEPTTGTEIQGAMKLVDESLQEECPEVYDADYHPQYYPDATALKVELDKSKQGTGLCWHYFTGTQCRHKRCLFSHDLRSFMNSHPSYKREYCRYGTADRCWYKMKCLYAHKGEEGYMRALCEQNHIQYVTPRPARLRPGPSCNRACK